MRCRKCLVGTGIYIFVLLLLVFMIVFVIVPMAFKYSVGVQKSLIFPRDLIEPNQNYSDVHSYGITGVRNLYINVVDDKNENVTLGAWQILPQEMISELVKNEEYNFEGALSNPNFNILLFLHGNGADRSMRIKFYRLMREFFHIFAIDYRGYADSTKTDINEDLIVKDLLQVYKWLKSKTKAKIFIWGHSLGTGVGTHLVSDLKKENISMPSGLVLEAPFTSVTDVMKLHPIVQFYSYMPWCKATMLDPIVDNGLDFNSKEYIKNVDCPIMILHAKDDGIIPYKMSADLYNIKMEQRNLTHDSKNITLHLYDETEGYGHMNIPDAPELSKQVREFIELCLKYEDLKHQ